MKGKISFEKQFALAKEKGIKSCDLPYGDPPIASNLFGRLRAGGACTTDTIAALCCILECQPGDIMEYITEENNEATED